MSVAPKIEETKPIINQSYCEEQFFLLTNHVLHNNQSYCEEHGLLKEKIVYKPFRYPWCYDAWLTQQRIHWLPEEVPLAEDVRDWQKKLLPHEKNLLTQIFRFFK